MSKDPALLLYTKDIYIDTASYTPEELGCYVRLLFYQHQNTSIPTDKDRLMRIVGVSDPLKWSQIWDIISEKFTQNNHNQMVNQRLAKEVDRRAKYYPKKIAASCLAGLISASTLTAEQTKKVKQAFDIEQFTESKENETIKENVKTWFYKTVNHMVNNIGTVTATIEKEDKGVQGEKENGSAPDVQRYTPAEIISDPAYSDRCIYIRKAEQVMNDDTWNKIVKVYDLKCQSNGDFFSKDSKDIARMFAGLQKFTLNYIDITKSRIKQTANPANIEYDYSDYQQT